MASSCSFIPFLKTGNQAKWRPGSSPCPAKEASEAAEFLQERISSGHGPLRGSAEPIKPGITCVKETHLHFFTLSVPFFRLIANSGQTQMKCGSSRGFSSRSTLLHNVFSHVFTCLVCIFQFLSLCVSSSRGVAFSSAELSL